VKDVEEKPRGERAKVQDELLGWRVPTYGTAEDDLMFELAEVWSDKLLEVYDEVFSEERQAMRGLALLALAIVYASIKTEEAVPAGGSKKPIIVKA
jgi:hypothetical protein